MTKTTFGRIAVGSKFTARGQTATHTKVDDRHAKRDKDGIVITVGFRTEVVPEHGATIDDILGSWSKL
jgi:hypothetical protein